MKRLVWTLCLTMGLTESLSALSTADYVQEGLVTHFDAIENVATGQPHANDATVWKDLKGNASITLKTGASWTDTAFVSSQTQHEIENMPAYHRGSMSFEVTVSDVQNGRLQNKDQWPRFFAEGEYFSIHFTNAGSQPCLYMKQDGGSTDGRLYGDNFRTGTIGMFSGGERFGLVLNGKVNRETLQLPEVATPRAATKWTLNGYSGWLSGNYRALRFYNRPLTADELHQNYVIDQIRFWNTYPQGYRQQDGVLQQCVRVKASENGVVTVDGNTLSADFEAWAPFKTAATYTLTAEPKEGYLFTGWQGDLDSITSGTRMTRSITVSRAFAMTLEPQFIAIPKPVMAEPVITIHVDKDKTVTLTDWLNAQSLTPGTDGTFVKTGAGELSVTDDIIQNFAGEIVIKEGCWNAKTRTGVGTRDATGGAIWVENGATLQIHSAIKINNTEANRDAYGILRQVYLIGTGWKNEGALIGSSDQDWNTEVYHAIPKFLTLLGDTKIGAKQHVNLNDLTVDLNGFTATVCPYNTDWLCMSGDWKNGTIVVDRNPIILMQPALTGGSENIIRFKKGSGYRANEYAVKQMNSATQGTWAPHGRWTAIFEDGSMFYGPKDGGVALGWNGPIVLEGHTKFTTQGTWEKFLFFGPISGSGDLGFNTDPANVKYGCLTLANRHNTFTGGIYLKRNALTAEYNGSIPAAGDAISAYDSSLYLKAAERYDLPDLTLTGTGLVYSAAATTGAFRHVTKSDATTVMWNTKVGASSFTLNAGTLAFGALSVSSGKIAVDLGCFSAAKGTQLDLAGNDWTCTNLTGAVTLLNGTLTVNGPWRLDAGTAGTLGGETGAVTFGEKAELILDNLSGLDRSARYTLASSTVPFTTIPPVKSLSDDRWQVRLSSDGRRLELSYSKGTTVLLR